MNETEEDEGRPGAPAWMATFADLMALMMCFFVLLLSFSVMDVIKFKQIAGSLNIAFGVQNQVKVENTPKGTSVLAKEFSPGRPRPVPTRSVTQRTTRSTKLSLQINSPEAFLDFTENLTKNQQKKLLKSKRKELAAETKAEAEKLKEVLKKEINEGKIDIESKNRSITIRIREKGSFSSGSDVLHPGFSSVIITLREALKNIAGKIAVEGHTDNIPIASAKFKSNWGLSAARALSVTYALINGSPVDYARFMVVGYADTKPRKPNISAQNRAENRRVEIVIRQGLDDANTITSINDILKTTP
ncbi:MAG: MotB family protein [Porticoccus sp.]|nr:MotB family protein [Porticoccus sp.]